MKLSILERLSLPLVFPTKERALPLKVFRKVTEALDVSLEERKRINWRVEGDRIVWDEAKEIDIPIDEMALAEIAKLLEKLEKEGQLPKELLSVYEKLVEGKKNG